ncbi:MAG: molybdopterin-dependent oxidoreductase [Anaerolineae bacterium]|nr:molybdopterin-dependent oxidoreductase [Anaerolineae bacterium]
MTTESRPTLWMGALVGAFWTVMLIAVFALAAQLLGTPFVPFDVFDWMARVLPGDIIRFGVGLIVSLIRTFQLGETSSVAKLGEQIMAVAGLFVTGIVIGALLFAGLRARRIQGQTAIRLGLAVGVIAGILIALISLGVNLTAQTSDLVSAAWIIALFAAWGTALGWSYDRLSGAESAASLSTTAPASVQAIDRRRFLVTLGGAAAGFTVVGAGVSALLNARSTSAAASAVQITPAPGATPIPVEDQPWSATNKLPNAADPLNPAPGTRPEFTPLADHYRIDINLVPPTIVEEDWTLTVNGLVENPLTLTLADIRANYEPMHQFVTLACISNPIGGDLTSTTRWTGFSLQQLVEQVKPQPTATHLRIDSVDGFTEYLALDTIQNDERVMLAYAWDGLPLEVKHGFPLRVYIPDRFGMKQPKWIVSIEFVEQWSEGYWVRRGWDAEAIMRATTVIDTVAVEDVIQRSDGTKLIPIGGIAHAGARGISRVEVKVDDADWVEANLRQPLSATTWTVWRYDWPFAEGDHTFKVRCVDGDGTPQIEDHAGVSPSGATGIHAVQRSL